MAFVELSNLKKEYGDITAVNDISLEMDDGEFVSILGPSGSGKTTTLRLMAGFEQPDVGSISVAGDDITGLPPEDREMSMVFQALALFPHLRVRENIAFGLKMRRDLSEEEIDERVAEVLEMVELPGYEDRKIQSLSGGEQQRIALARAIVVEPNLILFDEPLSDLDRQLRENMRREIDELHQDLGITSLYVTHNQREALTLADRIAVMEGGDIVRIGTPHEIYTNPQTEFVADFVGDANFLQGQTLQRNGAWVFEHSEIRLPFEEQPPVDGDTTLFVRPENLRLTETGTDNSTEVTITSSVHLGSVTEYTIEFSGEDFLVTELGAPNFEVGDRAHLVFEEYDVLTR